MLITITNNGGGGQPVSMANLRAVRALCDRYGVPFFLDAARFAENSWLVVQREPGYGHLTPREVARQTFALADGCVASLKKDAIAPMGAVIGVRDPELAKQCEANLIATEGFRTYGGLAAHDLERVAQGIEEVLDPNYLRSREADAAYFAELVTNAGVDIVQPPGIHALYLNAGRLLPHIPPHGFPGHALACEMYLTGGVRCVELGSLYLGKFDENHNLIEPAPFELVRMAIPRRTYTQAHLEYVADVLADIARTPTGWRRTASSTHPAAAALQPEAGTDSGRVVDHPVRGRGPRTARAPSSGGPRPRKPSPVPEPLAYRTSRMSASLLDSRCRASQKMIGIPGEMARASRISSSVYSSEPSKQFTATMNGMPRRSKKSIAAKLLSSRRVSTSTTVPMAPRASSSHMYQKRSCPGVPNRYSTVCGEMVIRPKSSATVVVFFCSTPVVSSMPALAVVISSSVDSGGISLTEPTMVVLPAPNPPAMMILTGVGTTAVAAVSSELGEAIEHRLK